MGALVAMVPAEFGSNKREGNRRRGGEGDFGVARERTGRRKGGLQSTMATLNQSQCSDSFKSSDSNGVTSLITYIKRKTTEK